MRKEVPEIGWGDFEVLNTNTPAVLAMRYDWRNNSTLFVHNLESKPRKISFASGIEGDRGALLVNLLTDEHSWADKQGKHHMLLEAYGYRWYRMGGLDYLLKRSEGGQTRQTPHAARSLWISLVPYGWTGLSTQAQ
jgi:maltose alpha-D-glucosyltransferase / alpha-amylase